MNETATIARASSFFGEVEKFAHAHPFVASWIAATILSWLLTALFKKPIRALLPDSWDDWGVMAFDVLVAFSASFGLLTLLDIPLAWLWVCALLIGAASPFEYQAFVGLVCWKLPRLRKYLTLGALAPVPDPTDSAAADADPPPFSTPEDKQ
jgi:hypothetical protein